MIAEPPVRVAERRQCVRAACGAVFTPSPDEPGQEACSRYCRSMLRLERAPTPVAAAAVVSPDPDPLASCPCLRHAEERVQAGLAPLPITIGGRQIMALPVRARS